MLTVIRTWSLAATLFRFQVTTHDLSLLLCRSNSRFPRESKPSPRPMPRPLPPRPPRPPPRPLRGLSAEGLLDRDLTDQKVVSVSPVTSRPRVGHQFYSLVYGELCAPLRLLLCRLVKTALTRWSAVWPLVCRSPFTLATLVLGSRLTLLVWSSAHPPDTCRSTTAGEETLLKQNLSNRFCGNTIISRVCWQRGLQGFVQWGGSPSFL